MNKWRGFLYLGAILFIVIPTAIVIITDIPFSAVFSRTVISAAIILIILGKILTVYEKKKDTKSFAPDVGVIIGLSIVLFAGYFNAF